MFYPCNSRRRQNGADLFVPRDKSYREGRVPMEDLYRSDYDAKQVETDPRFIHCRRDMILVQVVYLSFTLLLVVLSYWLCPDDISQMTYFLGLPLWVAVTLLLTLANAAFVALWAKKNRRFSLEAKADDSEVDN